MAALRDLLVEAARAGEPDRYLAALYAPEPARGRMIALAAFAADLARIAATVREPLLAEIRLQWWRDALTAALRGEATGHPIADRLAPDLASGTLPMGLLLGMVDVALPPGLNALAADPQALRARLGKGQGAAFALAARALGAVHSEALEAACQRTGFVYGLSRLLAASPIMAPDIKAAWTGQARQAQPAAAAAVQRLDSALLPAFLPLAMTAAYLGQANGKATGGAMPLRRWWRLARANLSGRLT
jgi:15-cis-phytoene synthase